MRRLFAALRPPPAIRRQLLDIMGGIAGARWQNDDQLHITLRFIGEVAEAVAEDIALALEGVRAPPLLLRLNGVGRFDRDRHPAAVWAGIAPNEPIAALHRKVDQALFRIGLPREGRAYLPHITLARTNRSTGPVDGFIAANAALSSPAFELGHFALLESRLASDGARYDPVCRWPLMGS